MAFAFLVMGRAFAKMGSAPKSGTVSSPSSFPDDTTSANEYLIFFI